VLPETAEHALVNEGFTAKTTESGKITDLVEKNDNINQDVVKTWQELEQQVAACQQCSLCQTRTRTVFGAGNKNAEWMLVGEAPGQNEDQEGLPFVGRAGQLLTEMIRALGLVRDDVFITNILKCRPPNNRDPKPEEVASCSAYLKQQIAMVQPKIILAVGRVAAQNLLQTDVSLSQLRGKVHYFDKVPVIVIYHPAYLLRSLLEKRKAWQDLQKALKFFRNEEN
jgi:DNA polymerase